MELELSDGYFDDSEKQSIVEKAINNIKVNFISDLSDCSEEEENTIMYSTKISFSNNSTPLEITFDDVDLYDFDKKTFNEVIKNQQYVHLYVDFDSITTEEEYLEVIEWLDDVAKVFGQYSIGGYTNSSVMNEKYGYRLIENDKHFLSIHVVFFTTCIAVDDLDEITSYTKLKGFWRYSFNEHADFNVYKCKTRQIWRHVLSRKFYKPDDEKNRDNRGVILNGLPPSSQIVQIRGNEPKIERDEWITVFPAKETPTNKAKREREERKVNKVSIDNIELDEDLIILNDEQLLDLLSNFESHNYDVMHVVNALYSSPYSKEKLIDILTQWQHKTIHRTYDDFTAILNRYYSHEQSNRWFFTLLKKLPEEIRKQYSSEIKKKVDTSVTINNSTWSFEEVLKKTYSINNTNELITKLRGVIGFVRSRWYYKSKTDDGIYIHETTDDKFMKMIKNYKPFYKNNKISLAQVVGYYSRYFQYEDAKITTEEDSTSITNLWPGFKYEESSSDDFTMLQPLLQHIKHVICNDDEEKYDYFMKWWANIFQKVTVKNGTMPIVHGEQGSGKSIAVELFCELLGKYALCNVDDLDKVFGKFNGLIGRNLVIVINEPPEAEEKQKFVGQIKSKLTQKKTIQETKGIDQIEITSWSNFIMTTNNPNPVIEEKGDRRMIYFETNNDKIGNDKYFKQLCKDFQPIQQGEYDKKYMGLLLHYMRTQIDVSDYNPEKLIRVINSRTDVDYNEQLERQYNDLNKVDRYIVDHADDFIRGIGLEDIDRIEGYKQTGIAKKLSQSCHVKRMRRNQYKKLIGNEPTNCTKEQVSVYTLKPREQIPSLYNIIEYIKNKETPKTNDIAADVIEKACKVVIGKFAFQ